MALLHPLKSYLYSRTRLTATFPSWSLPFSLWLESASPLHELLLHFFFFLLFLEDKSRLLHVVTVVCPPLSGWFSEPLAQSHPELGRGCVKMCIPLGMDAYMGCCPALSLLVPGSPSSFPCFCFLLPRDGHRRCLLCLLALSGRQVTPSDGLPDNLNSGSQKHRKKRSPGRPVYEFPPLKTPVVSLAKSNADKCVLLLFALLRQSIQTESNLVEK